jgi:signal transduction histidine kinase
VNRRVSPKLLLACLISALLPVGLAVWLFAAQGRGLSGWPLALSLLLSLALALVVAVLTSSWAAGVRYPTGAIRAAAASDDSHQAPLPQAERLAIVYQASQAISNSLELEEIYEATYRAVGQIVPNDRFTISLAASQDAPIEVVYFVDAGVRQPPVRLPAGASLAGQVLNTGQPQLLQSPVDWPPEVAHVDGAAQAQSTIVVPIRAGEQLFGVLTAQALRPGAFTGEDVPLLVTLASQAAAAIHNARRFEASQRQARDLDILVKAQSAASASLDLNAVLNTVAEQLGQALNVSSAYVVEVTESFASTVAEYYSPQASAAERVSDLHTQYPVEFFTRAQQAMAAGVTVTVGVEDEDAVTPAAEREHLRAFGAQTALVVPLLRQGRPLGYAELWESRRARVFTEAELRLAQTLAGNAAAALENAKLYAAARRHGEQMGLVNQIGRDISGILEVEALLVQVGRRLEMTFGYYHANLGLIAGGEVAFPARVDEHRQMKLPEVRLALDGPGLVTWVAGHSRPRYVADVRSDSDYLPHTLLPDTVSEAVVPLIAHGQTLGVLDVQTNQPAVFGSEEVATLEAICGQVAVAIDNARLFAEARRRTTEVSALLTTTLAVASSMDLDARLQAIAAHARRLVEADSCTVYQLSPDAKTLLPLVALDELYASETLNDVVVVGEGLIGQVVLAGEGVLANRADLDPRAKQIPGTPQTPECLMVVPLLVGARVTGVMAVYREGARDFTQHDFDLLSSFAAQAAVAIENADLYQKLRERADSLQAAYNELAEVDRLKDEMVQNISHELRTPLTFLKSYVELLLSGALGPLQPDQARSLQIVNNKTGTLVRLVSDIITLQAVTPATITRARLDLLELARAAADGVAAMAQEAGVELITDWPAGPVPVRGDALRLSQVFDNLLGNAIKFTGRGGQIRLSVSPEADGVKVEVRDTGIGIAPESLDRIFERFYQVDGTLTRRRGGIGLGLAICKLIVEVHGGQIGVASHVGAGTAFYFKLPLADGA